MEFFHLQSNVDSEFFESVVWAPNFFGHAKFEVKFFFLDLFNLQSDLDSEFFTGDVRAPTIFDHAKFEVKNFLGIFSFTQCCGF